MNGKTIKDGALALAACVFGGFAIATSAFAADKKAQERVAGMAETRDALLGRYPQLRLIDKAVRADCSAKAEGEAPDGALCSCGSAVTFSLWVSGIDPKMIGRIEKFLQKPNDQAAADFATAYQGPELYGTICRKAI